MVGAAVAVLPRRAAELRHGQDHDIVHAVAKIAGKMPQGLAEFSKPVGQLAGGAAFVGMGVPAADLGEGDFQPDIGFDQPGDLL